MRKANVLEFVSLDGVIQAPGGPEEDTSGGFAHGGWMSPHSDDVSSAAIRKQMNNLSYPLSASSKSVFTSEHPYSFAPPPVLGTAYLTFIPATVNPPQLHVPTASRLATLVHTKQRGQA